MAPSRATKAIVWVVTLGSVATWVVGCNSSAKAVPPTPPPTALTTTTIVGARPSDVVGWITPTLANGIAFVNGVAPGAPAAQLLRAAQSFSVACVASQNELKQTIWTGQSLIAKSALATSLAQTVALIAHPPESGFATALHSASVAVTQKLQALRSQVHS